MSRGKPEFSVTTLGKIMEDTASGLIDVGVFNRNWEWSKQAPVETMQSAFSDIITWNVVLWDASICLAGENPIVTTQNMQGFDLNTKPKVATIVVDAHHKYNLLHAVYTNKPVNLDRGNKKDRNKNIQMGFNPITGKFKLLSDIPKKKIKDWIFPLSKVWFEMPGTDDLEKEQRAGIIEKEFHAKRGYDLLDDATKAIIKRNILELTKMVDIEVQVKTLPARTTYAQVLKVFHNENQAKPLSNVSDFLAKLCEKDLALRTAFSAFYNQNFDSFLLPKEEDLLCVGVIAVTNRIKKIADNFNRALSDMYYPKFEEISKFLLNPRLLMEFQCFVIKALGLDDPRTRPSGNKEMLVLSILTIYYYGLYKFTLDKDTFFKALKGLFYVAVVLPRKTDKNATDFFEKFISSMGHIKTNEEFIDSLNTFSLTFFNKNTKKDELEETLEKSVGKYSAEMRALRCVMHVNDSKLLFSHDARFISVKDLTQHHHLYGPGAIYIIEERDEILKLHNRSMLIAIIDAHKNNKIDTNKPSSYIDIMLKEYHPTNAEDVLKAQGLYGMDWYSIEPTKELLEAVIKFRAKELANLFRDAYFKIIT